MEQDSSKVIFRLLMHPYPLRFVFLLTLELEEKEKIKLLSFLKFSLLTWSAEMTNSITMLAIKRVVIVFMILDLGGLVSVFSIVNTILNAHKGSLFC